MGKPDFSRLPPHIDVLCLCHGITKIKECGDNPDSYQVNVLSTIDLFKYYPYTIPVYLGTTAENTTYGQQKAEVEQYIRANYEKYLILKLPKVYSEEKPSDVSPKVHVVEVVETLAHLIEGENYGDFNIFEYKNTTSSIRA